MTRSTGRDGAFLEEVRVGQLWADNDWREQKHGGRQRLRVVGIEYDPAVKGQRVHLNNEDTGRDTWVLYRRMRPTSTGYRLVEEPALSVKESSSS